MRYLICPDSYKGSLTAVQAARAMAEGVLRVDKNACISLFPLADGGEGTAGIIGKALAAKYIQVPTADAQERPVESGWWYLDSGLAPIAILDIASATGLAFLGEEDRNIMTATSRGTGILMRSALEAGVREFIIGLGGSATNDGGLGILRELGWRFCDKNGKELSGNGEALMRIAQLFPPESQDNRKLKIRLLCDVDSPFYGPKGAARVYAAQKGATPEEVAALDAGLLRLNDTFVSAGGRDVSLVPGAGAAGGIGGMFVSLYGAEVKSGISEVLDLYEFDRHLADTDFVLTGEGRIDVQTLCGKTLAGIAERVRGSAIPLVGFGGSVDYNAVEPLKSAGFESIHSITPDGQSHKEAMCPRTAYRNLAFAVECWAKRRGLRNSVDS